MDEFCEPLAEQASERKANEIAEPYTTMPSVVLAGIGTVTGAVFAALTGNAGAAAIPILGMTGYIGGEKFGLRRGKRIKKEEIQTAADQIRQAYETKSHVTCREELLNSFPEYQGDVTEGHPLSVFSNFENKVIPLVQKAAAEKALEHADNSPKLDPATLGGLPSPPNRLAEREAVKDR